MSKHGCATSTLRCSKPTCSTHLTKCSLVLALLPVNPHPPHTLLPCCRPLFKPMHSLCGGVWLLLCLLPPPIPSAPFSCECASPCCCNCGCNCGRNCAYYHLLVPSAPQSRRRVPSFPYAPLARYRGGSSLPTRSYHSQRASRRLARRQWHIRLRQRGVIEVEREERWLLWACRHRYAAGCMRVEAN